MHRLPLELKKSPLSWDRSLPEYELFKKSQKYGNVHNMEVILDVIKNRIDESDNNDFQNVEYMNTLTEANNLYLYDDPNSQENFFYEVNLLIFRAPIYSPAFTGALLSRGLYFLRRGLYVFTISDLELFMKYESKERMENINLFRVHGLLSFCYYTTGKYSKSRKHLVQCNHYKELVSDELLELHNLDGVTCFIIKHVKNFEKEINSFVGDQSFFTVKKTILKPFGGFNDKNNDIPLCSASCYYVSEEDKKEGDGAEVPKIPTKKGIYASNKIPQGEYVLVENPILSSFATPFAHCAYCFKHQDQMYTCFKCRYKTYCSMKCMKQDKNEHDDECLGYKYLVLTMFDGTILIRFFMRLIKYLDKFVTKSKKTIRKLNTYQEVWDYLIESAKEDLPNAESYMIYFVTKPDLKSLSDSSFLTLLTYTFRLTVYVQNLTKAKEIFFDKLNLDSSNVFMLMGTMLLRLNGHIYLNSTEIEFKIDYQTFQTPQLKENEQDQEESLEDNENQLLNHYFYFNNKEREFAKIFSRIEEKFFDTYFVLPETEHTKNCPTVSNPLVNFMDNIANYSIGGIPVNVMFSFISDYSLTPNCINDLIHQIMFMNADVLKNYLDCYIHNFNFFVGKYFIQLRHRMQFIRQTVTIISTTLNKLNHSCNPNVKVMRLHNGILVGKTLRAIKSNEELTISYNANYLVHNRNERTKYLQSIGLTCQGTCCTSDAKYEPINLRSGIFCNEFHRKTVLMTPAEIECSQCKRKFILLLDIFYKYIKGFEQEIMKLYHSKGSIRDFALTYSCYYNFVFSRFTEGNEIRLKVEFKLAKFLAENNFLQQSATMIFAMRSSLKYYSEESLWVHFYENMMQIINIILNKVISNGLTTSLDINLLNKLVTLGFIILQGQERFYSYHHCDEIELLPFYENMIRLNEIKEIINNLITLPRKLKYQFFK